jgi:hypothetical protein
MLCSQQGRRNASTASLLQMAHRSLMGVSAMESSLLEHTGVSRIGRKQHLTSKAAEKRHHEPGFHRHCDGVKDEHAMSLAQLSTPSQRDRFESMSPFRISLHSIYPCHMLWNRSEHMGVVKSMKCR